MHDLESKLKQGACDLMNTVTYDEGALVTFCGKDGMMAVVPEGKVWVLRPLSSLSSVKREAVVSQVRGVPSCCIFSVALQGEDVGFRSWGAEGRMLQAVRRQKGEHRVTNYNFGSWETWTPQDKKIQNVAWPKKELGYEVFEVCSVLRTDILLEERQKLRDARLMGAAVRAAEEKAVEAERRLAQSLARVRRETDVSSSELFRRLEMHEKEQERTASVLAAKDKLISELRGKVHAANQEHRETSEDLVEEGKRLAMALQRAEETYQYDLQRCQQEKDCALEALQEERQRLDNTLASMASKALLEQTASNRLYHGTASVVDRNRAAFDAHSVQEASAPISAGPVSRSSPQTTPPQDVGSRENRPPRNCNGSPNSSKGKGKQVATANGSARGNQGSTGKVAVTGLQDHGSTPSSSLRARKRLDMDGPAVPSSSGSATKSTTPVPSEQRPSSEPAVIPIDHHCSGEMLTLVAARASAAAAAAPSPVAADGLAEAACDPLESWLLVDKVGGQSAPTLRAADANPLRGNPTSLAKNLQGLKAHLKLFEREAPSMRKTRNGGERVHKNWMWHARELESIQL
ncbi:hypothetical protein CYMTET_53489 [Cymbomonas tetramitiformis]|uniref:Uncharacterized protein n=1 Tax=Cymbomonas tetramitiformis TaxID=36881 RepID=A0AAE0BIN0_9CHLO|nr:hypothetical protein CYMTET_53489 [Cymbomonas tetramitiformis]